MSGERTEGMEPVDKADRAPQGAPRTKFDDMKDEVEQFRQSRVAAAGLNLQIQQLEADRVLMRKRITTDLLGQGLSKTQAKDEARNDPTYVKASKEIDQKTLEWEHALAYAEVTRLLVSIEIAEAGEFGVKDNSAIELKRVADALLRRVKQLGG